MLILTRRPQEGLLFILNEQPIITVTILGIKGNQVRIGANAPTEWGIHRDEVWQRIQKERVQTQS